MATIIQKRLDMMGEKVMEGILVCQGFRQKLREGERLTKIDKTDIEKLRMSTDRLMKEIQCYSYQRQGPSSEEIDECLTDLTTLQMKADDLLAEIDLYRENQKTDSIDHSRDTSMQHPVSITSRLPQLNLPTFDGNKLNWYEFWGKFTASIERRTDLSDIDKLTYLQDCLQGNAKELIAGLTTTNETYKIAVDTLTEEYGEEGIIIDAHYTALFEIPAATQDIKDNKRALNDIDKHLRVLDAMGENTGNNNAIRTIILKKFSTDIQSSLRMKITPTRENVTVIMNTLKLIIKALDNQTTSTPTPITGFTTETLFSQTKDSKPNQSTENNKKRKQNSDGKRDNKRQKQNQGHGKQKPQPNTMYQSNQTRKRFPLHCIFCSGGHIHENCPVVKTLAERRAKLRGRCYLCFKENHAVQQCTTTMPACVHCRKERHHNRALCPKICTKEEKSTDTVAFLSHTDYDTILQTALANIPCSGHTSIQAKLLFDCGSQKSYILSSFAKRLNLEVLEETCLSVFSFGSTTPKTISANLVNVPIQLKGEHHSIMAYVVPSTTGLLPSHHDVKLKLRANFPQLEWAEDSVQDRCADLIVGNDYYYKFVTYHRKEIANNLHLIKTELGWIPSGVFSSKNQVSQQLSVLTFVDGGCVCKANDLFFIPDPAIRDDSLKMLWELEAIGITDSPKIVQDENVIEYFNKTTKFIGNRYYVKWPWVEYPPILPTNLGLSFGRLQSLLKRQDTLVTQRYNEVLVEQRQKGIIEEVKDPSLPQPHPVHYLPHHCVIQEHRSTKLRIVYDASAKVKGQCSLNELMYKGPLMLTDLPTLLLNFRRHNVALVADIEKAFLQVGLQNEDRDVTRFLWPRDINGPLDKDNLIHYRFCRVPFGLISSPYLLAATIRFHLNSKNTAAAHTLASCLYVDNLITGADSINDAMQLYGLASESFNELSMNLRGWNSNNKQFVGNLPDEHRDTQVELSVLGLTWDTANDVLRLAFKESKLHNPPATTKRQVLRIIASVYDPCGFVAPLTLPTRAFLQDLWISGLKWDTPLSKEQLAAWDTCVTLLEGVPKFSIPRQYFPAQSLVGASIDLHCFTDASLDAYVAVIYIRVRKRRIYTVNFVMSRSRVTPLQRKTTLTIPKLELLAVVIGTRLLTYVQKALNLQNVNAFLWSDNQAVLGWLRTERLLPPWVSRRVGEVHKAVNVSFRYVPSTLNPADLATRPLERNLIPDSWVHGPTFLRFSSEQWPPDLMTGNAYLINETVAHQTPVSKPSDAKTLSLPVVSPTEFTLPTHGSQLPLPAIIHLQRLHFKDEVAGKSTNLSRSLYTFLDDEGIIRCKGRYQNAILPYDQRCPILLPDDSDLTRWVIQRVHNENYHVGISHTLALTRNHYWIPRGRNAVGKVIRCCPQCVKYGGGPYRMPTMPDLPLERINYSPPFTYTGVDYLGPLVVLNNGYKQKRWVCLYTCMAIRAVHLEVINDLSVDEFVLCLRRFISTRGAPKFLLSDNATTFKAAAQILASLPVQQHQIDWRFITELSPWQGGMYERLVGLVKHCLHRTMDKSLLRDTQLCTVIKEIEGILNTRPLTTVSHDGDLILTPSCFLRSSGPPLLLPPDRSDQFHTDIQRRVADGWKQTERLLDGFRRMFTSQYLLSLRERHTPTHKQPRILSYREPAIGDRVQLKGDTANRALWKVGRISALRPSGDNCVRSVQVTLDDGTVLNRSVGHLYPLELDVSQPVSSRSTVHPPGTNLSPPDTSASSLHPVASSVANDVSSALPEGAPDNLAQGRPLRQAAHRARHQIRQWVATMFTVAVSQMI